MIGHFVSCKCIWLTALKSQWSQTAFEDGTTKTLPGSLAYQHYIFHQNKFVETSTKTVSPYQLCPYTHAGVIQGHLATYQTYHSCHCRNDYKHHILFYCWCPETDNIVLFKIIYSKLIQVFTTEAHNSW